MPHDTAFAFFPSTRPLYSRNRIWFYAFNTMTYVSFNSYVSPSNTNEKHFQKPTLEDIKYMQQFKHIFIFYCWSSFCLINEHTYHCKSECWGC